MLDSRIGFEVVWLEFLFGFRIVLWGRVFFCCSFGRVFCRTKVVFLRGWFCLFFWGRRVGGIAGRGGTVFVGRVGGIFYRICRGWGI